jgi:hypothetical protein
VPEKTAVLLTDHKTRSVFDRYDILNEDDLCGAVKKLGAAAIRTKKGQSKGRGTRPTLRRSA